jgi:hypothetical protein
MYPSSHRDRSQSLRNGLPEIGLHGVFVFLVKYEGGQEIGPLKQEPRSSRGLVLANDPPENG